jgi:hypothetical protein
MGEQIYQALTTEVHSSNLKDDTKAFINELSDILIDETDKTVNTVAKMFNSKMTAESAQTLIDKYIEKTIENIANIYPIDDPIRYSNYVKQELQKRLIPIYYDRISPNNSKSNTPSNTPVMVGQPNIQPVKSNTPTKGNYDDFDDISVDCGKPYNSEEDNDSKEDNVISGTYKSNNELPAQTVMRGNRLEDLLNQKPSADNDFTISDEVVEQLGSQEQQESSAQLYYNVFSNMSKTDRRLTFSKETIINILTAMNKNNIPQAPAIPNLEDKSVLELNNDLTNVMQYYKDPANKVTRDKYNNEMIKIIYKGVRDSEESKTEKYFQDKLSMTKPIKGIASIKSNYNLRSTTGKGLKRQTHIQKLLNKINV